MQTSTRLSYWKLTLNDKDECRKHIQQIINEGTKRLCLLYQFNIPPDVVNDVELMDKLNRSFCILVTNLLEKSGYCWYQNGNFIELIPTTNPIYLIGSFCIVC